MRIILSWIQIMLICLTAALVGCHRESAADAPEPSAAGVSQAQPGQNYTLTIYGYNYTDRYIDQFEVEGQGGGNLDVSTPSAGGGKGACCIGWREGTPVPQTLHVRWVSGGCMQKVTNRFGETTEQVHHSFTEKDVVFTGPVPRDPGYLEVHFFPDGHIEIAITALPSDPRLKLDPRRGMDPYPSQCEKPK